MEIRTLLFVKKNFFWSFSCTKITNATTFLYMRPIMCNFLWSMKNICINIEIGCKNLRIRISWNRTLCTLCISTTWIWASQDILVKFESIIGSDRVFKTRTFSVEPQILALISWAMAVKMRSLPKKEWYHQIWYYGLSSF